MAMTDATGDLGTVALAVVPTAAGDRGRLTISLHGHAACADLTGEQMRALAALLLRLAARMAPRPASGGGA